MDQISCLTTKDQERAKKVIIIGM